MTTPTTPPDSPRDEPVDGPEVGPVGDRDRRSDGRPENARPRDRTGRPLPHDTDVTDLAVQVEPETVEEALALGVQRWDRGRYFEAHELLEFVWHWALDEDKDFWQGVIQVAAACVHDQRGNPFGVVRTIDKALPKLTGVPADHHGIDVAGLRAWCRDTRAALQADARAAVVHPVLASDPDGIFLDPERSATPLERRGGPHRGSLADEGPST